METNLTWQTKTMVLYRDEYFLMVDFDRACWRFLVQRSGKLVADGWTATLNDAKCLAIDAYIRDCDGRGCKG